MPQFHKRKPGSRGYLDYHTNDMVLSRESVQKGMTWREVAKEIDVSQSTLTHQVRSGETNNLGQPPVLSMIEENIKGHKLCMKVVWYFSMSLVTHEEEPWLVLSGEILKIWPVQIAGNCYLRLLQRFIFSSVAASNCWLWIWSQVENNFLIFFIRKSEAVKSN